MLIKKQRTIWKTIKKVLFSALVMLVLFLGAGVAYVYYTGRSADSKRADTPVEVPVERSPIPEPVQPAANAPASGAIVYLASPVKAGENSSVNVHTNPKANCKIAVLYNEVASKDSGLVDRMADARGNVEWSWTVDKTAPVGKWPVKINCFIGQKSVYVQGDLVVTP